MNDYTQRLELTGAEQAYLSDTMDEVSRSFAIVVRSLEEPLKHYMATAYLICRIVDNIEDCTQLFAWKQQRFQEFHQLVEEPASAPSILAFWGPQSWPGLTEAEAAMMGQVDESTLLWEIYARIPEGSRASIRRWTLEMADGMLLIEDPNQHILLESQHGVRVLAAESDYNAYCFYVAGTVGHMATELSVIQYGLSAEVASLLAATCEACGRGLQKTNILKDFAEDLGRGVSYLPYTWHQQADLAPLSLSGAPAAWKRKVILDVVQELHVAAEYAQALPYSAAGYRMASLMTLLPAYQTLLLAAKRQDMLFTPKHHVKISRQTMVKCQWDAKSMLLKNDAVRRYCHRIEDEIQRVLA